jgi:diaminohydroxyphosphoribosylaminopyrimidine deaminase/5-amino-6-(5-phosphoribosylamino)uracil reductase
VLDELGALGHLQLLVEGGATVAHDLHAAGLVDRYVLYLAPVLFGGDDGAGLFSGKGAHTIADVRRGTLRSVTRLGDDVRLDLDPAPRVQEG